MNASIRLPVNRVKILMEFDLPIRSLILGIYGRADVLDFI